MLGGTSSGGERGHYLYSNDTYADIQSNFEGPVSGFFNEIIWWHIHEFENCSLSVIDYLNVCLQCDSQNGY